MAKRNQHVVPYQGDWAVRGANNQRVTSIHRTQKEAVKAGRRIARNQETELFVHGKNGRIRERDSYGNDPFPPEG